MTWYYLFKKPDHTQLDFFEETAMHGWSIAFIKMDCEKTGYGFLARVTAGRKAKPWADRMCEGGIEINLAEACELCPQLRAG